MKGMWREPPLSELHLFSASQKCADCFQIIFCSAHNTEVVAQVLENRALCSRN